jgi:hypothetical protein
MQNHAIAFIKRLKLTNIEINKIFAAVYSLRVISNFLFSEIQINEFFK